jgi:IS5 family transposase
MQILEAWPSSDPDQRGGSSSSSPARKATGHKRSFRRLVKWRTGSGGRISHLKRGYGWDRTRLDGRHAAAIWCGHRVFAHSLIKIAALAA